METDKRENEWVLEYWIQLGRDFINLIGKENSFECLFGDNIFLLKFSTTQMNHLKENLNII
jgi:hypothetical protein